MRHDAERPPLRHRLPRPLRFLVRIVSTALILSLMLVFLPHLTRLVGRLWPDPARTEKVSALLRHELNESARLETLTVDDQGVLTATVQAALLGEVQRVTIEYDYHASIGVDLTKIQIAADNGILTLILPPFEMLGDSLTPTNIDRQDFWYPLTEKRRSRLLEEERSARAEAVLEEAESSDEIWHKTAATLMELINTWLGPETWLITVDIRKESYLPAQSSGAVPAICMPG